MYIEAIIFNQCLTFLLRIDVIRIILTSFSPVLGRLNDVGSITMPTVYFVYSINFRMVLNVWFWLVGDFDDYELLVC